MNKKEIEPKSVLGKKLLMFIAGRPWAAVAKEIGINQQTLEQWIKLHRRPRQDKLQKLSAGTRIKLSYWVDDSIGPKTPEELESEQLPRGAGPASQLHGFVAAQKSIDEGPWPDADIEAEPGVFVIPDAEDIRSLEITGDSAGHDAYKGQVVWYDYGKPGDVKDGDSCVVIIDGVPMYKRRKTNGTKRYYLPVDPLADATPIDVPLDPEPREYPVVATLRRHKRVSTAEAMKVTESVPNYDAGSGGEPRKKIRAGKMAEVTTKDGEVIRGELCELDGERVVIRRTGDKLPKSLWMSNVESIAFG